MQIEKQINELCLERWTFIFIDKTIYLDSYILFNKERKRSKKFNILKKYNRTMNRDNTILESDVPFTSEIKSAALRQFVDRIKVLKWNERKNQ